MNVDEVVTDIARQTNVDDQIQIQETSDCEFNTHPEQTSNTQT